MVFDKFLVKCVLASSVLAVPFFAMAATPPAVAMRLDASREGDLASKVQSFFLSSGAAVPCDELSLAQTKVTKVSSSSLHETKTPGTATIYDAIYLVQRVCFSGSTFVGAYRDGSRAVFIKATRRGVENARNVIIPSVPDVFTVVSTAALPEPY